MVQKRSHQEERIKNLVKAIDYGKPLVVGAGSAGGMTIESK